MGLRAHYLLAENIKELLRARKQSQRSLATWCGHSEVWISKFLLGKREVQLKDLDKIADYFGFATYQLFQPGISRVTERRKGRERRSGKDRRVSDAYREMLTTRDGLAKRRVSGGADERA